jgi:hypothetical protein
MCHSSERSFATGIRAVSTMAPTSIAGTVDPVQGAADLGVAVEEGPKRRQDPAVLRQKTRVKVEHAQTRKAQGLGVQDLAEADRYEEVGRRSRSFCSTEASFKLASGSTGVPKRCCNAPKPTKRASSRPVCSA